ncbi:DUF2452 domain-containing protein [Brumimicrobium salinarum]|uniref:DUF2452 domain-containing protein n=1 Tax=Brumimicrobium salinarum TaxID=2058658 RepID=A0A2I0R594_9FLAO|nr:DUF2452 domain-containing protein [Brumimicrobium salinarum]PKR81748.1 DUF2452 domain-containing protein [Brumimicrobium salinarum]
MSENKKDKKNNNEDFINPIDPDHITENPHNLPYPHTQGSALVKPEDEGRLKGRALNAMEHQTDMQLKQLYDQMNLLAEQAKGLQDRKVISEKIYNAEMRFEPLINHIYHLYQKENKTYLLSLIAPDQWGRSKKRFEFVATVQLLADHTWDILEKSKDIEL